MNKKFNKKFLLFGVLGFFALALVTASLLLYYGQINQPYDVEQAVTLSGNDCSDNVCTDDVGQVYSPDTRLSGLYVLTNHDPINPRDVELKRTSCGSAGCSGITTSYLKEVGYIYSSNIAGVLVDVTDEGEWLKWTYTYADNPTHTPKMTVAINYPDGFAITTFDDGSHDGWYYAPDGKAEVRLGDYAGVTTDWVETTANGNVLTVEILKSKLCNTFKWHGFANYNGAQVWINAGQTGVGYGEPPFVATLNEVTNPITVPKGSITFYPEFSLDDYLEGGVYNFGFEVQ